MSAPAQSHPTSTPRLRERLLAASPLTERHELLAGVSTALFEGGEGPPIILVHGQGEFWAVWLKVIEPLTATHRVVAVDLPGHGASTEVEGELDADRVLRWFDEVVDATCTAPPVVAGHLLGGAIAARYAASNSRRLGHLVLVDPLGLKWYLPSLRFAIPMVAFVAKPTPRTRDRLFDRCFVDFDQVGDNFGDLWDDLRDYALDRAQTPENQAALRSLMPRVGLPPIPPDDLAAIDVPTTLIHGRHDLQVPLRAAERASQRYGWPLHVIEGAADDPAAEQPDAFLDVLYRALGSDQHEEERR